MSRVLQHAPGILTPAMSNDSDILLWEMIEVGSVGDETSYASEETISRRRKHQATHFANFPFSAVYVGRHTIGPSTLLRRIRDSSCTIPIILVLVRAGFGAGLPV
jgi:hypothetical protein